MKISTKKLFVAAACVLLCGLHHLAAQSSEQLPGGTFLVIVHQENSMDALSRSEVSKIFLKHQTRWPDGEAILPVDHPLDDLRNTFSKVVHGRSAFAVKSEWTKRLFAGQGLPPPLLSTDEEVVAFVSERPGAIGYVAPSARLTGVKRLKITDD